MCKDSILWCSQEEDWWDLIYVSMVLTLISEGKWVQIITLFFFYQKMCNFFLNYQILVYSIYSEILA